MVSLVSDNPVKVKPKVNDVAAGALMASVNKRICGGAAAWACLGISRLAPSPASKMANAVPSEASLTA